MKTATTEARTRSVFRLSVTAMFIALTAIVAYLLPIPSINLFGEAGISVGFSGVFTAFPAFLFGPLYGGIASACSDIIGVIVNPTGPYNPCFTIVAFLGGYIKGLIWVLLRRRAFTKTSGLVILSVLLVIGSFGAVTHISLKNDGISDSLIAKQDALPARWEIDDASVGAPTKLLLAVTNANIVSVKNVTDVETLTIPTALTIGTHTEQVTRIRKNAFRDCVSLKSLYVPDTITKLEYQKSKETGAVATHSFSGLPADCVIYTTENSATADFCKTYEIPYTVVDEIPAHTLTATPDNFKVDGLTFDITDTFRKYFSAYASILSFGMELVALGGILLLVSEWILTWRRGEKKSRSEGFVRIFLAITISGLLVTTINTQLLIWFVASYAGRAFWLLWIPRFFEELVVCTIQAYLISVLYNIFERQIKPRLHYFQGE